MKYLGPDGENLTDPKDPKNHQQVPPEEYEKNIRKLVERLQKTNAKLIWRNTTPVPEGAKGRVVGDSVKYNAIAAKVMKDNGIDVGGDKMVVQRLKEAAEKAKIELSSTQETEVNLPFLTADASGPKHMNLKISRSKLEQLIDEALLVQEAERLGFTEDEMEEGNHQKVVLTHSYWQERFAGAQDVVGRDLRVDGQPFSIVGVLPADFRLVTVSGASPSAGSSVRDDCPRSIRAMMSWWRRAKGATLSLKTGCCGFSSASLS